MHVGISENLGSMDPMPTYIYTPLPGKQYIRLLRLQSQHGTQSGMAASLETYSLAGRVVPYTALSYSWGRNSDGDASSSRRITIDGYVLCVTENLYAGLEELCSKPIEPTDLLWIDAICINQGNLDERSQQVAMMGTIYAKARSLTIWLGRDSDRSIDDIAFETICSVRGELDEAVRKHYEALKAKERYLSNLIPPPPPPPPPRGPQWNLGDCEWLLDFGPHGLSDAATKSQLIGFALGYLAASLSAKSRQIGLHKTRNELWPKILRYGLSSVEDPVSIGRSTTQKIRTKAWMYMMSSVAVREALGAEFMKNYEADLRRRVHALDNVFNRRYFCRRWIIQEILKSKPGNIIVRWGEHYLTYRRFINAAWFFHHGDRYEMYPLIHHRCIAAPLRAVAWNAARGMNNNPLMGPGQGRDSHLPLLALEAVREDFDSGKLGDLRGHNLAAYFLVKFTAALCSDPRDQIFAFSGLHPSIMIPDYRIPASTVYTKLAGALVVDGRMEDVLVAAARQSLPGRRLRELKHDPPLPSWVPDFRGNLDDLDDNPKRNIRISYYMTPSVEELWRTDIEVASSGAVLRIQARLCDIDFSWHLNAVESVSAVSIQRLTSKWRSGHFEPGDMVAEIGRALVGWSFDRLFIVRPVRNKAHEFRLVSTTDQSPDSEIYDMIGTMTPRWIELH